MCKTCDPSDPDRDRETDQWLAPADLRDTPTASVAAPESDAGAVSAPVDPPRRVRASQALTRDGGER